MNWIHLFECHKKKVDILLTLLKSFNLKAWKKRKNSEYIFSLKFHVFIESGGRLKNWPNYRKFDLHVIYHTKKKFSLPRIAFSFCSIIKTLQQKYKRSEWGQKKGSWSTEGGEFDLILPALKLFGKKRELKRKLQRALMTKD